MVNRKNTIQSIEAIAGLLGLIIIVAIAFFLMIFTLNHQKENAETLLSAIKMRSILTQLLLDSSSSLNPNGEKIREDLARIRKNLYLLKRISKNHYQSIPDLYNVLENSSNSVSNLTREILETPQNEFYSIRMKKPINWAINQLDETIRLIELHELEEKNNLILLQFLFAGIFSIFIILEFSALYNILISKINLIKKHDALIDELELHKKAIDASSIVGITDKLGIITYVNDKFCEITGYSRDELIGRTHKIINSDFHTKDFFRDMWATISSGQIWKGLIKNKKKNGDYYWVDSTIFADISKKTGKPERYIAIRHDVSQLKIFEAQLIGSFTLQEAILSNSPYIIITTNKDGLIKSINKSGQYILGYTLEEVVDKKTPLDIFSIEEIKKNSLLTTFSEHDVDFSVLKTLAINNRFGNEEIETSATRRNGRTFPILLSTTALITKDGKGTGYLFYARDISYRKKTEKLILDSMEKYKILANNVTDIISRHTLEGIFIYVSPSITSLTGYTGEELIDKNILQIIHEEDASHFQETISNLKESDSVTISYRLISKFGREIWMESIIKFLKENNADGSTGFIAVSRDITERKISEEHLQHVMEQSNIANNAKSEFLAVMSHELRTPMNGVIGMSDLLLTTDLNTEQFEYASSIQSSGKLLLTVINDILDYSKIESGKLEIEINPVQIETLIENTIKMFRPLLNEKKLNLINYFSPEIPKVIFTDVIRIRQVLNNLIGNAVKFTHQGQVGIKVELVSIIKDPSLNEIAEIKVSVSDTGIGIPEEKIDKLFNLFTQVDSSTTRKYGGTGLGLAISKKIVSLLGGDIGVASKVHEGSTFYFTIRAEIDHAKLIPPTVYLLTDNLELYRSIDTSCYKKGINLIFNKSLDNITLNDIVLIDIDTKNYDEEVKIQKDIKGLLPIVVFSTDKNKLNIVGKNILDFHITSDFSPDILINQCKKLMETKVYHKQTKNENLSIAYPLRILVAEDNVINQKVAIRLLEKIGYSPDLAENGGVVLEKITEVNYDIIFMDIQMPVLDGIETTRLIRDEYQSKDRPVIIAMTANTSEKDREICLAAGMNDYIIKPIDSTKLESAIKKWFNNRVVA